MIMQYVDIVDRYICGITNKEVNMKREGRKNNETREIKFIKD